MAKRMALVPMDMVSQMKDAPLLGQLSALDKEMEDILRETTSNDLKLRKYQDALRRYHQLTDIRDETPVKQTITVEEEEVPAIPHQQIIRNMPAQKQRSAKILLDFLETMPELSVNDRNEISIHGKLVKNSNIHDLVSDLTRDTRGRPPKGLNELTRALKVRNVPLTAIGSSHRKTLFTEEEPTSSMSSIVLPSIAPSVRSRRPLSSEDFEMPRKSPRISRQGPRQNFAHMLDGWEEKAYK